MEALLSALKNYRAQVIGACALLIVAGAVIAAAGRPAPRASEPSAEQEAAAEPVAERLAAPADTEAPRILGAADITAMVGETLSYRAGVTVTDNVDANVALQIDASAVNMELAGEYPVVYTATDASGNTASVTITVTVTDEPPVDGALADDEDTQSHAAAASGGSTALKDPTVDDVNAIADRILAKITTDDMALRDKALAVYNYVYSHIQYVGSSDKSSWVKGAYVGFTYGRGDCFNYFACSKVLLNRLGVPTVDLQRVGGTSRHYWLLANIGDGWRHFDACWAPRDYPHTTFLLTETEVRAYTEWVSPVRVNYYVYDYDNCPVFAVGTPEEEIAARQQLWAERAAQDAEPAPEPPPADKTPAGEPSGGETLSEEPSAPDTAEAGDGEETGSEVETTEDGPAAESGKEPDPADETPGPAAEDGAEPSDSGEDAPEGTPDDETPPAEETEG